MRLDALIIANTEAKNESEFSPMRLTMDDYTATIQEVYNYLVHNGQVLPPVVGGKNQQLEQRQRYGLNGYLMNWQHDTMEFGASMSASSRRLSR